MCQENLSRNSRQAGAVSAVIRALKARGSRLLRMGCASCAQSRGANAKVKAMPKTQDWKQMMEASRQHSRELEVRHCSSVPRKPLPEGRVLVHNHIAHTKDMPAGVHGFRFWTQKTEPNRLVLCKCGWQGLTHYHVKGVGSHKSFTHAEYQKRFGHPLWMS